MQFRDQKKNLGFAGSMTYDDAIKRGATPERALAMGQAADQQRVAQIAQELAGGGGRTNFADVPTATESSSRIFKGGDYTVADSGQIRTDALLDRAGSSDEMPALSGADLQRMAVRNGADSADTWDRSGAPKDGVGLYIYGAGNETSNSFDSVAYYQALAGGNTVGAETGFFRANPVGRFAASVVGDLLAVPIGVFNGGELINPLNGYSLTPMEAFDAKLGLITGMVGAAPSAVATLGRRTTGAFDSAVRRIDIPSWGQTPLEAIPGRTTTIIGRWNPDMESVKRQLNPAESLDFGAQPGGFNMLNVPGELYTSRTPKQFFDEVNRPWLQAARTRDDVFAVATPPEIRVGSLTQRNSMGNFELTTFGREYLDMRRAGYIYDFSSRTMLPQ